MLTKEKARVVAKAPVADFPFRKELMKGGNIPHQKAVAATVCFLSTVGLLNEDGVKVANSLKDTYFRQH